MLSSSRTAVRFTRAFQRRISERYSSKRPVSATPSGARPASAKKVLRRMPAGIDPSFIFFTHLRKSYRRDRSFNSPRFPCLSRRGKRREDGAGKGLLGVGSLRMPLDRQDEMAGRVQLDRLNHPVLRGNRGDQQIVSGETDRLMVA